MPQGIGTPKVSVATTSGNLLRQIQVTDGIAGLVGTATAVANIGVVRTVYGYDDALAKGYTAAAEPFLNAQIQLFYQELGGNQELWILGVQDTMLLAQMVDNTNNQGLRLLLTQAQGRVTVAYVCRKPPLTYTMPVGFLDSDVSNAVVSSKALCQYQQSINRPIRLLIEGRTNDITQVPYAPNTANNTYVGIVLGSNSNNGSACGVLALARACKYGAHIKIGNGQNSSLSIAQAFIGNKPIENFTPTELDNFAVAGYIILHRRDGAAGYYFSVDAMAGADDYKLLALGRLIDKAQRIATATMTPLLETGIGVSATGFIKDAEAAYLESLVKAQILAKMTDQISNVAVFVPLDNDIINTSTLTMQVKIQPLGYLTWMVITLGLSKTI